jgi:hypothetical protein
MSLWTPPIFQGFEQTNEEGTRDVLASANSVTFLQRQAAEQALDAVVRIFLFTKSLVFVLFCVKIEQREVFVEILGCFD